MFTGELFSKIRDFKSSLQRVLDLVRRDDSRCNSSHDFFGIPFTYNVGCLDTKLSEIIIQVIIYWRSFYGYV